MMRTLAILAIAILIAAAPAGAEPWKKSVEANLTLTQNAYSDNWVGGETGAISWAFTSVSLFEKQLGDLMHSGNTLKLQFGQTHNQDVETKNWSRPAKSTDLIDFESVLRFTLGSTVDPYAGVRLESQFVDQSDRTKDRYVNPLKITESAGIARVLIDEETRDLVIRLGGAARQFIDRDRLDPVTLERATETTNDLGLLFDAEFKTNLAGERITYGSKLTAFQAIYYSEADAISGLPNEDYWKSTDVKWENLFTAGITKYLMVSLYVELLYDKDVDLKGRFKEILALGVTYKFM
ncbi:MAG: DUF3078 domain-containing protein [Candidatus Krumholzibacteriota bacterium]|nr:DUF3078 domain-containing protein [Candidatus Krumholzibacteriota bacterium]